MEKPLRDLARNEPLMERARGMSDVPVEIPEADVDAMAPADKAFLTQSPPAPPLYSLFGTVYKLNGAVSDLTEQQRYRILELHGAANGIKLVRVTSVNSVAGAAELDVYFYNRNYLKEIGQSTTSPRNIFAISGGARVRGGGAMGQIQVSNITWDAAKPTVLTLIVQPIGDYSTYALGIVASAVKNPPASPDLNTKLLIDPLFSEIRFKFRPGCFNNNCAPEWEAAPPPFEEPVIDYLAKDYGSFRQTMIDAMAARVPGWEPTSEADLDVVLAELFSVAADELSDYQDRVMNEAYFTSARKRVSLARHARLMDYHIHQGSQASTWLSLEVGHNLAETPKLKEGLKVWAGDSESGTTAAEVDTSVVFLSRQGDLSVHRYLNNIGLYTWSDTITSLKAGSTRADLKIYSSFFLGDLTPPTPDTATGIAAKTARKMIADGNVKYLVIQEHLNPETGLRPGRNPAKRQLLKLIPEKTEALKDPITDEWFVRVRWEKTDALRHDYCFTVDCPAGGSGTAAGKVENVSLFHGNLVEVFHGRERTTIFIDEGAALDFSDPDQPLQFHYERARWGAICRLPKAPLAYRQTTPGGDVAPVSTLAVSVSPPDKAWKEVPSFIHSDDAGETGDHFVVETDENRHSIIRFGNGVNGRELPDGAKVTCKYQYGLPLDGNVGADRIINFDPEKVELVSAIPSFSLRSCWNPFDVTNGIDREPAYEIVRRVPEAYRYRQLRAVTLNDYIARAEEIPGISRAAARYSWTGSWRTVRVTIDPAGTTELSYALSKQVADYLNAIRLIGEDLEIRPPIFVPLEINVILCAAPDFWPEDIKFVLEQEFSAGWTPDGRRGFFHPDEWTFGQPLYASQIIGRALQVRGIEHAVGQTTGSPQSEKTISVSIKRWNSPYAAEESLSKVNYNEIIQVMNDPDHLEQGFIRFWVRGGRQ